MRTSRHGLRPGVALLVGGAVLASQFANALVLASPSGDACRKDICNSAVSSCLRADEKFNPLARTEAEKQSYCATFFNGCMTRSIVPDLPWYSPELVARFLQCPP